MSKAPHHPPPPPTRAPACLEAIGFACHVFGVEGAEEVITSSTVRGTAAMSTAEKHERMQKSPLQMPHVRALDRRVSSAPPASDRVFAGFICCLVHTRLRGGVVMPSGAFSFCTSMASWLLRETSSF